jgi:hypothetical protein
LGSQLARAGSVFIFQLFFQRYNHVARGIRIHQLQSSNGSRDLLFAFEQASELSRYEGYQQRIIGFVAERLLTLWVTHQNLSIKELPLIYFKKMKKE